MSRSELKFLIDTFILGHPVHEASLNQLVHNLTNCHEGILRSLTELSRFACTIS